MHAVLMYSMTKVTFSLVIIIGCVYFMLLVYSNCCPTCDSSVFAVVLSYMH